MSVPTLLLREIDDIALGVNPVTYGRHTSIELPLIEEVIVSWSTGWLVGGEIKVLMRNENYAELDEPNKLLAVTLTSLLSP